MNINPNVDSLFNVNVTNTNNTNDDAIKPSKQKQEGEEEGTQSEQDSSAMDKISGNTLKQQHLKMEVEKKLEEVNSSKRKRKGKGDEEGTQSEQGSSEKKILENELQQPEFQLDMEKKQEEESESDKQLMKKTKLEQKSSLQMGTIPKKNMTISSWLESLNDEGVPKEIVDALTEACEENSRNQNLIEYYQKNLQAYTNVLKEIKEPDAIVKIVDIINKYNEPNKLKLYEDSCIKYCVNNSEFDLKEIYFAYSLPSNKRTEGIKSLKKIQTQTEICIQKGCIDLKEIFQTFLPSSQKKSFSKKNVSFEDADACRQRIEEHLRSCINEGLFDVRKVAMAFLLLERCRDGGKDTNYVIIALKDKSIEDVDHWANCVYTVEQAKTWIKKIPSTELKHFNMDDDEAKKTVIERYKEKRSGKFSCLVGSIDDLARGVCELLNRQSIKFEYLKDKQKLCTMKGNIMEASQMKNVWECSASGTQLVPWVGIDLHYNPSKGVMYHCVPFGSS